MRGESKIQNDETDFTSLNMLKEEMKASCEMIRLQHFLSADHEQYLLRVEKEYRSL